MRYFGFYIALAALVGAALPAYAESFELTISVPNAKADGSPWDQALTKRRRAPEISLCYTDPGKPSEPQICLEKNDLNRRSCNDAFSCTIPFVQLPKKELYFYVMDLDLSQHDVIGQGRCTPGRDCRLGGVKITFGK